MKPMKPNHLVIIDDPFEDWKPLTPEQSKWIQSIVQRRVAIIKLPWKNDDYAAKCLDLFDKDDEL